MSDLTEQERKLVQEILTRFWLSMILNNETGFYETNGLFGGDLMVLAREQMDAVASAINKI